MSTHILTQIYEVQTPSEAEKLVTLGVDHIGSVIISQELWKSPIIKDTVNTIHGASKKSSLIPLFDDINTILFMLDYYRPDMVHFCEAITHQKGLHKGCERHLMLQENVKKRFPEINIMRSIPIPQSGVTDAFPVIETARMFEPVSDYFLTDTLLIKKSGSYSEHQPVKGFVGITGKTCDWDVAAELVKTCRIPVILAGGITPDNVFHAIKKVQPAGVDSCTGTNAVDVKGRSMRFKKDLEKVRRFVDEVHRAEKYMEHG